VKIYFLLPKDEIFLLWLNFSITQIKHSIIFVALKINWRALWREARSKWKANRWTFEKKRFVFFTFKFTKKGKVI